jgi:tubulin-specific chaperone D
MLAEAYLESLQQRGHGKVLALRSHLLQPLPRAVAGLLYSFCKIRGEKVVVRFLNAESKYLELLLSALEESEAWSDNRGHFHRRWTWQERYVTLLWLSHLLFAPFDLASISSVDLDDASTPTVEGFKWPANLPGITIRILPIAMKYLASPGKERDAAKALLVRISMRRDMQELGVLDALVKWSLWALRPAEEPPKESPYYFIGILSYLGGVLRSSMDTSDMDRYLVPIFNATHAVTMGGNPTFDSINGSSFARKMMIKVIRSAAVLILRQQPPTTEGTELVETCIESFLESVGDTDTPVRLSASKALSIVTLRLDPDMAAQVVEAVLEALNRKVLWKTDDDDDTPDAKPQRDLSSVNLLEWHGLMLTLSHLLYRRSPPADQLTDIIHALLLGLAFEQRSTSGISVGGNVRDAACFGIWALARRYTTRELLEVPTESIFAAKAHPKGSSILQVLATELVVTASRDPAGNIRRGASAALQELVGRHPDTVEKGIWVVQTVDYHAVALRSRAIHEVSLNATKLATQYGEALLDALLGWRGVGDADAAARRVTGTSFGTLTMELAMLDLQPQSALKRFNNSIQIILNRLKSLESRQAEERHGLLLSLAAILDKFPELMKRLLCGSGKDVVCRDDVIPAMQGILCNIVQLIEDLQHSVHRRQDLVAEAASRLVVSSLPIFQAAVLGPHEWTSARLTNLDAGPHLVSTDNTARLLQTVSVFDRARIADGVAAPLLSALGKLLPSWLDRHDEDLYTSSAVSEAALVYLMLSTAEDRHTAILAWSNMTKSKPTSRAARHGNCYFTAMTMAYPLSDSGESGGEDAIVDSLVARWANDKDIESRVAILQAVARSDVLRRKPLAFLDMLAEGLDDYTTTARGDVGSHVRLAALRTIKVLWTNVPSAPISDHDWIRASTSKLFLRVLRLAAEKLDRVRNEAHQTLVLTLKPQYVIWHPIA